MTEPTTSMKVLRVIENDNCCDESRYEVGPDLDDNQLVEIRYRDDDGCFCESMVFTPEEARLVAKALALCADEMSERRNEPAYCNAN